MTNLLLRVALLLAFTNVTLYAQPAETAYAPTLIVDPNSLGDSDLGALAVAIVRSKLSKWHPVPADRPIYQYLAESFSFADGGPYPLTARMLAEEVRNVNGLPDFQSVGRKSKTLLLPPLPVRPKTDGAEGAFAQILDVAESSPTPKSVRKQVSTLLNIPSSLSRRVSSARSAANWWVSFTLDEIRTFRSQIPQHLLRSLYQKRLIYLGPTSELANIRPNASSCADAAPERWSAADTTPAKTVQLDPSTAGRLVLMDRFIPGQEANCKHGLLVSAVANEVVKRYSPSLAASQPVVQAEIDFFADMTASGKTLDAYIATFPADNVRKALTENKKALLDLKKDQKNPLVVPLFFVSAVLDNYLRDPNTAIVSTSVWFQKDGYEYLPRDYDPDGKSMLLAAVSDDDVDPVEKGREEPIVSFLNRKDGRTLLVGAYGSDGQPFGARSTSAAICCPGLGEGWSATAACKQRGTSFATPQIAALLYLAQAFWRQGHGTLGPRDALLRLIASSHINPNWIGGSYASAGIPQLEVMLTTEKQYLATKDLSLSPFALKPSSSISLREDGARFKHQVALACGGDDGVCAMKVVSSQAYILRKSKGRWEKVIEIDLNLQFSDGSSITSLGDFESRYEGIYNFSDGSNVSSSSR